MYEFLSLSTLKVELAVERIEDRLKEYDMVHAAAFRSYFATHPEVTRDMVELEKSWHLAVRQKTSIRVLGRSVKICY